MIRLIKQYMKDYIPELIANVCFVILQIVIQTVFLIAEMKKIIDQGVGRNDMNYIVQSGIKMLLFTLAIGVCTVIASYLSARVTAGLTCKIREACFQKVVHMAPQDYNRFGGSTLLTRTMADGTQIQILLINLLRTSLMVPIIIICMLGLIFKMNKVIFAILFFSFLVTVLLLIYLGAKSRPLFETLQQKIDRISLLMKEKISGVRAIRAFGNQKLEEDKLATANEDAYEYAIKANKKINFLAPLSMIIMNWAVVLIYFAGTTQLQQKMVSISDLLLVFQYLTYFIASLAVVPVLVNMLPKVSVSCKRINELLDYEPEVTAEGTKCKDVISKGKVEFQNVIFGYSGATNVIADISFTAQPGKTTAFIGTTGSGKTTIMNLLMGLYVPTFGEIRIDGTSIREINTDYLRDHISYGTQKAMVFQDTARVNVSAYQDNCSQERIQAACDAADFTEVIKKMPEGLDTVMSQGGMNISGGQRQRLSLARTIAKDASIYIFDDTFSALDANTEARTRANIKKMLAGKTVIMVAQKINSIIDADTIVVLKQGRIVGTGKHEELLKSCEEYADIYRTQCYVEKEA